MSKLHWHGFRFLNHRYSVSSLGSTPQIKHREYTRWTFDELLSEWHLSVLGLSLLMRETDWNVCCVSLRLYLPSLFIILCNCSPDEVFHNCHILLLRWVFFFLCSVSFVGSDSLVLLFFFLPQYPALSTVYSSRDGPSKGEVLRCSLFCLQGFDFWYKRSSPDVNQTTAVLPGTAVVTVVLFEAFLFFFFYFLGRKLWESTWESHSLTSLSFSQKSEFTPVQPAFVTGGKKCVELLLEHFVYDTFFMSVCFTRGLMQRWWFHT